MSSKVEIIAEAGVNHNGSLERAVQLVDAAVLAGADVVKFQTFSAAALASSSAPMAAYQQVNTGVRQSQLDMLRQLELPLAAYAELQGYCRQQQIEFMSSPFDRQSLDYLVQELGVGRLKLASGEITNAPLLLAFAQSGCELIVSTGMCSLDDIDAALSVLAFGMLYPGLTPEGLRACREAFVDPAARALLQQRVTLLHCTSQYPAPVADINLRAMDAMRNRWQLPVGYSDHSEGLAIAIAAAALGAVVVEKHFTLDRSLPGPDHKASLEPAELSQLVAALRAVTLALGDGDKRPQASEQDTKSVARKSLVAACEIAAGDLLTEQNMCVQRPGTGISALQFWDFCGRPASADYRAGELLDE